MLGTTNYDRALRRLRHQTAFLTGLLCLLAVAAVIETIVSGSSVDGAVLLIAAAALAVTTVAVRTRNRAAVRATGRPARPPV